MERTDDTGFGGIRVIQVRGSGYGVDAVLLAAFAAGETGSSGLRGKGAHPLRIADLGTGCGVIAFIAHHKLGGARLTGYDVSASAIDRAERACAMNGLKDDVDFVCCDMPTAQGALVAYPDMVILDFSGTDGDFQFTEEERAENVNIGVSMMKGNTTLREAIDSVLSQMTPDNFNELMAYAISISPSEE